MKQQPGYRIFLIALILASTHLMQSCYSLKTVSLPPEIETFNVENFTLQARNAPPAIDQIFTEQLKSKIRSESRLQLNDRDPHIVYSGQIVGFNVTSLAPEPGETVAFNRLEIRIKVKYVNTILEDKDWEQTFSFFSDFSSEDVLTDLQDDLIDEIYDQIAEDIFNKTFSDW